MEVDENIVKSQDPNDADDDQQYQIWLASFNTQAKIFVASRQVAADANTRTIEVEALAAQKSKDEDELWLIANSCPRGRQYGRRYLLQDSFIYTEDTTESGMHYNPGNASRDVSTRSGGLEIDPGEANPLARFMSNEKLSLYESAPGSRWPQRLSAQRNSGFAAAIPARFRKDALNEMLPAGLEGARPRIQVPLGLQAAVAGPVAKNLRRTTKESDEELENYSDGEVDPLTD